MSAAIHHLPPIGCIKLPRELRRQLNVICYRRPELRARLERRAVHVWLEYGPERALDWLKWG